MLTLGYARWRRSPAGRPPEAAGDGGHLTCGGMLVVAVLGVLVAPASLLTLIVLPLLAVMVALTFGRSSRCAPHARVLDRRAS